MTENERTQQKQSRNRLWHTPAGCLGLSSWPLPSLLIHWTRALWPLPPVQRWRCWWVSLAHCWRCWTRRTSAPPPRKRRPPSGTSCSRSSLQVREGKNIVTEFVYTWFMFYFKLPDEFLHIETSKVHLQFDMVTDIICLVTAAVDCCLKIIMS